MALASKGFQIIGIEPSPDMLKICRSKMEKAKQKMDIYPCSLEHLEPLEILGGQKRRLVDNILVPGETFMSILSENTALEVLEKLFNHLTPGGQLIIDLLSSTVYCSDDEIKSSRRSIVRSLGGKLEGMKISCEMQHQWNGIRKWRRERQIIKLLSKEGEVMQSEEYYSKICLYSTREFIKLLEKAGFVGVKVLDFVSFPHGEDKTTFRAKKPECKNIDNLFTKEQLGLLDFGR